MKKIQKGTTKRVVYGGAILILVFVLAALALSNFRAVGSQQARTSLLSESDLSRAGGPCVQSSTAKCGKIIIIEDTVLDTYQNFDFSHTIPGYPSSFTLDDDSTLPNPSTMSHTQIFSTPYTGFFVVTEIPVSTYSVAVSCTDPSGGTTISGTSANISLYGGETITCTFINTKVVIDPAACTPNTWTQKANMGTLGRRFATGFSIGNKGYMGIGGGSFGIIFQDFWEYNTLTNVWTQKADFGGGERYSSVGFSIGTRGYVGTGSNGVTVFQDFWEYNPATNMWTQKADVGGGERHVAVGFSIGNKGYVGTGSAEGGDYRQDFWEYNPATNMWTQKADVGGGERGLAAGFSIANKGYIGIGWDGPYPFTYYHDFWEYNPATNMWTQKADFPGLQNRQVASFSIGNKGYIGTGLNLVSPFNSNDFWEYNPATNMWTQKADVGGGDRSGATGFSIGNKGYIAAGYKLGGMSNDFWQYCP